MIRKLAAISLLVFSTIAANDVAPSNAELEAMYDKAFRAFDASDFGQALKELDAIDARKPDLAASQNLRGVIYMRQGVYDKAEAALTESQRLDPKFWNARFNLAEIPFLKKDWPAARKRFQELLTSNAADLQGEATQLIQYKILLTYVLEENDTMVDSILAKFELSPDTPAVHYANAAIALQHKNVADARKWITAAEKDFSPQLNKLFEESLFEVGWLQQPPGQHRTALQLLSPEERENGTKVMVQSQMDQAQQAYEQRDFDRASKLAEQADGAQPNQPAILNLRGEILLEQGKFAEAEEFFSKSLKADGKFREAQFNLADVPFRQKDYAKARDRFQALLKATPGGDKNQAAQLINFKVFMTYLLEGKESRAQKLMEQFQFSGDTPALYYAQAAWEFRHGKTDAANDWIASARKIYPSASNAAYSMGFYDLGWLKSGASAASSPAPSAAVGAAAVASSAQNESPVPAIEPSPIPGADGKSESAFVSAQMAASSPVPGTEATTTASPPAKVSEPAVDTATGASVNAPTLAAAQASATLSPPPVASSPAPTAEAVAANTNIAATPTAPLPSASPVVAAQATAATALAPAKIQQLAQPGAREGLDRHRTLLWIVLLVVGLGVLGGAGIAELRRRMNAPHIGNRPAPATGPDLHSADVPETAPTAHGGQRFTGAPRQVSVQLKASEPTVRQPDLSAAKSDAVSEDEVRAELPGTEEAQAEPGATDGFGGASAEPVIDDMANARTTGPEEESSDVVAADGEEPVLGSLPAFEESAAVERETAPAWQTASRYSDSDESSVGLVTEQTPVSERDWESTEEPALGALRATQDGTSEETVSSPVEVASEIVVAESDAMESAAETEILTGPETETVSEPPVSAIDGARTPRVEPAPEESAVPEESPAIRESVSTQSAEPPFLPEPIAQGQPVPYQTVPDNTEAAAEEEPETSTEREMTGVSSAISGVGALRGVKASTNDEEEFSSQPTTIHTMPETLQTPTAPVIRTPAGSNQPSPTAPAPHAAAAAGIHTAVHITLSCEIASMQLTPTFKMGALQLRPISKVVTMRLASSQQQQNGMNLQVNFEITKVQPAPGSLGQVRLAPSQQQKPATLNSPSFNISGLQVVSGFDAAPLQLTPSQQGQASVHLTAAFQIGTVEFSPTFDVAAMILNSSSKTVSVQLPGAAGGSGDGPLFEITNVQLTANGEIGMLQLNPATTRRG